MSLRLKTPRYVREFLHSLGIEVGGRSIRIPDNDTGFSIIVFFNPYTYRIYAFLYDAKTYMFIKGIHQITICWRKIYDACYREDKTRNLHVESHECDKIEYPIRVDRKIRREIRRRLRRGESVRDIQVKVMLDHVMDLYELLLSLEESATYCLDCFDVAESERVEEKPTFHSVEEYRSLCFYNRCEGVNRVGDPTTCIFTKEV